MLYDIQSDRKPRSRNSAEFEVMLFDGQYIKFQENIAITLCAMPRSGRVFFPISACYFYRFYKRMPDCTVMHVNINLSRQLVPISCVSFPLYGCAQCGTVAARV